MLLELGNGRVRFSYAHCGMMAFAAVVDDASRDYKNGGLVGDRRAKRVDLEDMFSKAALEDCVSEFSCG
jgi:hypothetical protein